MNREQSGNLNPIELQRNLKGVDYPANKREIIAKAHENGAVDQIIQYLEQLPE